MRKFKRLNNMYNTNAGLNLYYVVCTRGIRKLKNVLPLKIFIDNRKEKEYAGFITHLHLLLHIEALVVP
jgi:hypothetical protein